MRRSLYDLAALIARIALGVIFIAHGWQKLTNGGLDGTTAMFAGAGVPQPRLAAGFSMAVELGGSILLILGLLTPIVAFLLAVDMFGAFIFVHMRSGVFGFELVAALGSAALLLATAGAGRFSLDHLIFGRRREHRRAAENTPAYVPPIEAEPLPRIPPTPATQEPPATQELPAVQEPRASAEEEPRPPLPPAGTPAEPPDTGSDPRPRDAEPPSR